jgi:hypothetical protein
VAIANEPATEEEFAADHLVYGLEGAEALVAAVEQALSNSLQGEGLTRTE